MVMIIRVSTLFVVVVIAAKAGLFVADTIKHGSSAGLADGSPVEKRVAHLIDEGVRRRAEVENAADGVANMARALALSGMVAIDLAIRVAGRVRKQIAASMFAVATGAASVITSRAFRQALGMVGKKPLCVEAHLYW